MKNIMTIFIIGLIAIVGSMILLFLYASQTIKLTNFINKETSDFKKSLEISKFVNSPYYAVGSYNLLIVRSYKYIGYKVGYKENISLYFDSFIHKDSVSNIKGIEINNVEILINGKKYEDFKLKNLNTKLTYIQEQLESQVPAGNKLYSCRITLTDKITIPEIKDNDKMMVKLNVTFHKKDNTTLNKQFEYTFSVLLRESPLYLQTR